MRWWRQTGLSMIGMAGGVSLAVIPAATLSIASRIYSTQEQGIISVAVTAATFIGQLAFAAIVEARLSSPSTERRVVFPRWLAAVSVAAALAVALFTTNPVVLCCALPILVTSLEVGRGVSVAEHLDIREAAAAALVGIGALVGLGAAYLGQTWGMVPLVAGISVATIARALPVPHAASRADPKIVGWVLLDVGITGVTYPVLNSLILVFIGPVQAVLFTTISTVSGLLAIPLNFVRLRLLKTHSRMEIVVGAAAVGLATIVVGVLEFTGLLGYIFAGTWTIATTVVPLAIACLWRAASLLTTIPFTALRRTGHARLLTVLRACCAIVTFTAGLAVVWLHSLTLIIVVMLAGELLQAATYEFARRRVSARSFES